LTLARSLARGSKYASRKKIRISGSPAFRLAAQLPVASRENAYVYGECTSGARHLNTPRLIADSTGTTVWRWDQGEPFGNDVPNNNPSGAGAFDFPLRFPGQFADRETGNFYNMARDYWPDGGRYIESDPIGLRGGINMYSYVRGNPISRVDPRGLAGIVAGVNARGFIATLGISGGTALVLDLGNLNGCVQVQICSEAGLGLAFTATANLGLNTGTIQSGTTRSSGIFGAGGAGLAGMGSIRISDDGSSGSVTSGAIGAGAGFGAAGGIQGCFTTLVCLREPPQCPVTPGLNISDIIAP